MQLYGLSIHLLKRHNKVLLFKIMNLPEETYSNFVRIKNIFLKSYLDKSIKIISIRQWKGTLSRFYHKYFILSILHDEKYPEYVIKILDKIVDSLISKRLNNKNLIRLQGIIYPIMINIWEQFSNKELIKIKSQIKPIITKTNEFTTPFKELIQSIRSIITSTKDLIQLIRQIIESIIRRNFNLFFHLLYRLFQTLFDLIDSYITLIKSLYKVLIKKISSFKKIKKILIKRISSFKKILNKKSSSLKRKLSKCVFSHKNKIKKTI